MTPRGFGATATPSNPVSNGGSEPQHDGERRDEQGRLLCTAHRTDGAPCRGPAMTGQKTCRVHGGMLPQARRAARDRLADEADPSISRLVWERDHAVNAADRIRAANSLLDRAGLSRRQAIDVNTTTYLSVADARQMLLEKVRELRAAEAQPATEEEDDGDVIDAEIVEDDGEVTP